MSRTEQSAIGALVDLAADGDRPASLKLLAVVNNSRSARPEVDQILDLLAAAEQRLGTGTAGELLVAALFDQTFLRAETHRILLRQVEVDESVQETMLAIIRALPAFKGDSSVRTWARAIARNTAIGHLRRRRETTGIAGDVADLEGEVERFSSLLATRSDLASALDALPPDFAAVVRLRDIEHLSYEEIAERLGIKLNTVRSRLARGRARLAVHLEPRP